MKKIFSLLILIALFAPSAFSQESLNVDQFFSDTFAGNPHVTMVSMAGDRLKRTGLRKYKSISVVADDDVADAMAKAVKKDGANAKSKEVSFRNGQLYFGFYSMGGSADKKNYLLFLDKRGVGGEKTTLIYLQGNIDEKKVKQLISK